MQKVLLIQPIAYYNFEDLEWLARELAKAFENLYVTIAPEVVTPRTTWFDWSRLQYVSHNILLFLSQLRDRVGVDFILGVAEVDAYSNGLNFVFGEALLGKGVAVVYTRRLHPSFYGEAENKELYLQRLLKEALHELGHSMGLDHCTTPGCVMNFSNSIVEVDAKKPAFCQLCVEELRRIGIKVSRNYVLALS